MLTSLSLENNRLCGLWFESGFLNGTYDPSGIQALAAAIGSDSAVLKNLALNYNPGMSGEAAQDLADSVLTSKSLEVFSRVPIKQLREGKLTELDLNLKGLGPAEGIVIAKLVATGVLTTLNLASNRLGAEAGEALADSLAVNTVLTSLNLANNRLGAEAGEALAASLAVNRVLQECSLLQNNLDIKSAKMLAKIGTEKHIILSGMKRDQTEASFYNQGLQPADGILIASDLAFMAVLTSLDLSYNNLDAEAGKALAASLAVNAVLTSLNLKFNEIGPEGANALKSNGVLTSLNIHPQIQDMA